MSVLKIPYFTLLKVMDPLPGSILRGNPLVHLQLWDRMVRFISEMKMELFMQSTLTEPSSGLMRWRISLIQISQFYPLLPSIFLETSILAQVMVTAIPFQTMKQMLLSTGPFPLLTVSMHLQSWESTMKSFSFLVMDIFARFPPFLVT